ncbi:ABC transporter substrate-binding protein [Streptomyces sp. NPDC057486]|uniref:ABC transporter substrate-binding protein n=1 Tax=Streptomyces sp. NPDC057486 TaxID=3346145 RepID=UPI003680D053
MDQLTVTSTGWNPNYLPQNVAEDAGLFAEQGLQVIRRPQDPWENVLTDLASGEADVALGGLWVPAMYHGTARDLVAVGQLNGRYAQAVVTRARLGEFDWSWLRGKTMVVPGAGGTAGYTFTAGLMREAGVDPSATRFVRDLSTEMLTELFESGLGDALLANLVTAADLQHRGVGVMSLLLADVGGPIPNSVYYVRRDRLDELSDRLGRFLTAVQGAMNRLVNTQADDLTKLALTLFPDIDPAVLRTVTGHLLSTRTWESVRIDRPAYDRWISFQHDVPLLRAPIPYDDLVDTQAMDVADPAKEPPASS